MNRAADTSVVLDYADRTDIRPLYLSGSVVKSMKPKWRESPEFRAFVASFGRLLPLKKPSAFGDKAIIHGLISASDGLTGKVTTLLSQAAELAIRQKVECITADLIEQAAASGTYKLRPVDEASEA